MSRLTGHFRDEPFQAITCTGTDNKTQNKQEKIYFFKHKNPHTPDIISGN